MFLISSYSGTQLVSCARDSLFPCWCSDTWLEKIHFTGLILLCFQLWSLLGWPHSIGLRNTHAERIIWSTRFYLMWPGLNLLLCSKTRQLVNSVLTLPKLQWWYNLWWIHPREDSIANCPATWCPKPTPSSIIEFLVTTTSGWNTTSRREHSFH